MSVNIKIQRVFTMPPYCKIVSVLLILLHSAAYMQQNPYTCVKSIGKTIKLAYS